MENGISRRQVMAAAAAGGAAMAGSRALAQEAEGQPLIGNPPLPQPPGERLGWAVVGLGSFGVGQVIPGFLEASRSRMTAFVSGNREKAQRLGGLYGVDRFYSYETYDDLRDDAGVDCVYIVLPVGLHAEYTIRALEAGKHVLCEKPMASTSAECERMIAAARANGRQLGVAYRCHFEPTNMAAKERIAAGEIGALRHVRGEHGFNANPEQWPPHKWRLEKALAGGGSMFDIGIYGLNTALMMAAEGDRPLRACATYAYPADDPRFSEVEGGMDWRLEMSGGAVLSGSSSYCMSPYVGSQTYLGSEGAIHMDPATTYYDNNLELRKGGTRQQVPAWRPVVQFAAQVDAFSMAAREGRAHRTPGEMGYRDIRLIEAFYQSADSGGMPVDVSGAV